MLRRGGMDRIAALTRNPVMIALVAMPPSPVGLEETPNMCRGPWPERHRPRHPGSAQDFVVNVGDRVFFDTDATELSRRAGDARSARRLAPEYPRYSFTIEGHADERGTREYNFALGAQRAEATKNYLISRGVSRIACEPSATAKSVRSRFATTFPAGRRTGARSPRSAAPVPSATPKIGFDFRTEINAKTLSASAPFERPEGQAALKSAKMQHMCAKGGREAGFFIYCPLKQNLAEVSRPARTDCLIGPL